MKKQIMTAFAFSTMMTLAMSFASFAAARSCQTDFRPENNCGYTGTNAVSVIQMQDGCVISNRNAIDLYTLLGKDTLMGQSEITAAAAVQPNPRDATALSEQTAVQIPALAGTA